MNKARLQVALDFIELPRALKVAQAAIAGGADIIEAGTPLIKSEGLDAVRKLREMFPAATIVADMKTMDAGRIETEAAAKALGVEYEIEKITDINEIMKFGVMLTPALVVDGEVKVVGKVPDPDAITEMLQ